MNFLYALGNAPNVLLAKYGVYGFWVYEAKMAAIAAVLVGTAILLNRWQASRNQS